MASNVRGKQVLYDQILWEGDSWDEGMNIIAELNCWNKKNATRSRSGDRVQTLACGLTSYSSTSCGLKGRLREDSNSNEITLETSGVCSCVVEGEAAPVQHGLPKLTKIFLMELFDAKYTTVGMAMDRMRHLQKKGELPINMPLESKVVSFWRTLRTKTLTTALLEFRQTPTAMSDQGEKREKRKHDQVKADEEPKPIKKNDSPSVVYRVEYEYVGDYMSMTARHVIGMYSTKLKAATNAKLALSHYSGYGEGWYEEITEEYGGGAGVEVDKFEDPPSTGVMFEFHNQGSSSECIKINIEEISLPLVIDKAFVAPDE